jgi:hypothetical protein
LRNITQSIAAYNPRRRLGRAGLVLLLVAIAAVAGCEQQKKPQAPPARPAVSAAGPRAPAASTAPTAAQPAAAGTPRSGCAMSIDLGAVDAYDAIAGRLARHETVDDATYAKLCSEPAYAEYMQTVGSDPFGPNILRNVMRYVYAGIGRTDINAGKAGKVASGDGRPGADGGDPRAPKRQDLVMNFSYLRDHPDKVQAVLQGMRDRGGCRALALLEDFVPRDRVPAALTLTFVQATTDIRYRSGRILVDTGLAAAAGEEQLVRMLAANLYRGIASAGEPSAAGTGREALAATFVKLQREAVAAWLEGYPWLQFDHAHKQLGVPDPARTSTASNGARAVRTVDKMVVALMADGALLGSKGATVDDLLRGNGVYPAAGYMMASLIAARLGEERWRAAANGSPADFLRAYQEAAKLASPPPPPERFSTGVMPPAAGDLAAMPAFQETAYKGLLDLLQRPGGV